MGEMTMVGQMSGEEWREERREGEKQRKKEESDRKKIITFTQGKLGMVNVYLFTMRRIVYGRKAGAK